MQLDIRTHGRTLDPWLADLCERQCLHSLGRLEAHVARVRLRLKDVNGPKGGDDQRCRVQVWLVRGGSVTVECTADRAAVAVCEALDRVGTAVLRTVQRRQRRGPVSLRMLRFA